MHTVEQRFTWGHQAYSLSGSLYNIHNTQTAASKERVEHCLNCQNTLRHVDDKDIEVADFYSELLVLSIAKGVVKRALTQENVKFLCKRKSSSQCYKFLLYFFTCCVGTRRSCGQWE